MSDEHADKVVHGETLDGAGVRLEGEGDGEWIESDYREGWVGRKLMNPRDPDAYDKMVEPYLLKCAWCRQYMSAIRWGKGSALCPHCEQKREFSVPQWFERTDGGIDPEGPFCPECASNDLTVGVDVDYDSVCNDCGHSFHIWEAPLA